MQLEIGSHLDDTDLEQYSMGSLPEARLAPIEEHFLACELCQDRLLETQAYVNAVRSVSPKLRQANRPRWRDRIFRPAPAWVAVFAMGMIVIGLGRGWLVSPREPTDFTAVFLNSSRGIEGFAVAKAPAGKPLSLGIDLTELPDLPSYRLEIVDAIGKQVWQTPAGVHAGKTAQLTTPGFRTGQYFVRLSTADGKLLREFGLLID